MTQTSNQYKQQIDTWTGYTHYLLAVDGLLQGTEGACKNALDAATFKKVDGAIMATHLALQGVDKELIDGINNMNSGKAPEYEFNPSPIPNWPTTSTSGAIFLGAWESIKGVLETLMSKATPSSTMAAAIAGLLNSGDACADALEKAFS